MKIYLKYISLQWQAPQKRVCKRPKYLWLALCGYLIFCSAFSTEAGTPLPPTDFQVLTEVAISGFIFRGDDTTKATRAIKVEAYELSNPVPVASFTTPTGFYTLKVPAGFIGTIRPSATNISFVPAFIEFSQNPLSHYSNNNFSALYSFYVSPNGVDSNTGSALSPLLNIQSAANLVYPGDRVYIAAGTYYASNTSCGVPNCENWEATPVLKITRDGTPDRPILFEAIGDDIVKVDGRAINADGVSIGASYITISKLIATNFKRSGFRILASWKTTGAAQAVYGPPLFSGTPSGRKVSGVRITECVAYNNSKAPTGFFPGFSVNGQVDSCVIENNVSYNNGAGIGLREADSVNLFRDYSIPEWREPWPDAPRDCIVRKNIAYNNRLHDENSDGIGGRYLTNVIFEDNIAFGNVDDNFDIGSTVNSRIIGNIAFDSNPEATLDGDGNGIKVSTRKGGGNTIRNNISFLNPRAGFDDDDGTDNVYQNNTAYRNGWLGMVIESDVGSNTLQNNLSYLNGSDVLLSIDCPNAPPFAPHVTDYNYWGDGKPPVSPCNNNSPFGDSHSFAETSSTFGLATTGPPLFVNLPITVSDIDVGALATVTPGNIQTLVELLLSQIRSKFSLQSVSPLINKGFDIGQPFEGVAPDIGAVESH